MLVKFLPLFVILFFPVLKARHFPFARGQDVYDGIRRQIKIPMFVMIAGAPKTKYVVGNADAIFVSPFRTAGCFVSTTNLSGWLCGKAVAGK
jgi:hypothetical protein